MRTVLSLSFLLLVAGTAQAATLTGTTWAEPESVTVEYDQFARDENGDYIRNEDGSLQRVEQTFTLYWDMELQCTSMQSPGEPWEIFASNIGKLAMQNTATGEEAVIFDMEPKEIMVNWSRDSITEPWTAQGSAEIRIINEQIPEQGQEFEYQWAANAWIANSCYQEGWDESSSLDFQNHTIVLPGVGSDPGPSDDGPDTRTPSASARQSSTRSTRQSARKRPLGQSSVRLRTG